jgi:hypothetical protein
MEPVIFYYYLNINVDLIFTVEVMPLKNILITRLIRNCFSTYQQFNKIFNHFHKKKARKS